MAGNIRIIEPKENYQKVSKEIILNEDVDFQSLGLYVKVLALGKKWELNIKGLASLLHIGEDKVRRHFAVLEKAGYLRRNRVQGKGGKFTGWDYEIGAARLTDIGVLPTSDFTDIGVLPTSVFSGTNKDIKDNNKIISVNIPPTPKQVADYVRPLVKDPEGFAHYYCTEMEGKGWTYGKDNKPVKNWKSNVHQWIKYHRDEDFSHYLPLEAKKEKELHTMSDADFNAMIR